jgi:hypothetical protein
MKAITPRERGIKIRSRRYGQGYLAINGSFALGRNDG